jgi:hypothetical protein
MLCRFPSIATFHFSTTLQKRACPLEYFFIFSFQISLYSLLYQNEAMSALDELREGKQAKGR